MSTAFVFCKSFANEMSNVVSLEKLEIWWEPVEEWLKIETGKKHTVEKEVWKERENRGGGAWREVARMGRVFGYQDERGKGL
jgi:hypothetical protein